MGTIQILLIVWGVVTALLVCTMIYRSNLASHEEDQLFLDSAGESMAQEQRAIVARIERLGPPIVALAVASGLILAAIVGLWLHQSYQSF